MGKKIFREKGITLIALVVTIVVLLILSGVSINLVVGNNGIITKAKEAKIETRAGSVEDERNLWMNDRYLSKNTGDTPKTMEEILTELETKGILTEAEVEIIKNDENNEITIGSKTISFKLPVIEQIKIGDYVNYTYDEASDYTLTTAVSGCSSDQTIAQPETALTWRVLSINDDGTVDLISNRSTEKWIKLTGSLGYNNGVYTLNDMCAKLFSNTNLGITARSIALEDIEKQMNSIGMAARNSYENSNSGVKYGNVKTYEEDYSYYPNLYAYQKGSGINNIITKIDGINESDITAAGYTMPTDEKYSQASTNGLTVTQTYYYMSSPSSYFDDSMIYSLIFRTSECYWVATRYSDCEASNAKLGIRYVYLTTLNGCFLYGSNHFGNSSYNTSNTGSLRPIVSLSFDIVNELTKDSEGVWQINDLN